MFIASGFHKPVTQKTDFNKSARLKN